jgi:hypothetical protein
MTARATALTPVVLAVNGSLVTMLNDGTGMTATGSTNGDSVDLTGKAIPATGMHLLLVVLNTQSTGRVITIRGATSDGGNAKTGAGAGNGPAFTYPGFEGGKGDLALTVMTATTGIGIFGPFEIARFLQPDGTISVDYAGATGFIKAILVPRAY